MFYVVIILFSGMNSEMSTKSNTIKYWQRMNLWSFHYFLEFHWGVAIRKTLHLHIWSIDTSNRKKINCLLFLAVVSLPKIHWKLRAMVPFRLSSKMNCLDTSLALQAPTLKITLLTSSSPVTGALFTSFFPSSCHVFGSCSFRSGTILCLSKNQFFRYKKNHR